MGIDAIVQLVVNRGHHLKYTSAALNSTHLVCLVRVPPAARSVGRVMAPVAHTQTTATVVY